MKGKKMVDYGDSGILKDSSVITLIADYNASANTIQKTVNEIKGDLGSHAKVMLRFF
jgi:hypothetical protein